MKYCPYDTRKANSSLIEEIENYGFIPLPIYFIQYDSYNSAKEKLKSLGQIPKSSSGILITISKIDQQLQQFIRELNLIFDIVFAQGGLNKINRFLLESTSIDVIVDPHSSKDKIKSDFIHHFNSGINHILATFAKEKGIILMTSLNQFEQKKKNIAKDIGRIQQNIKLARKYSIPLFCSYYVSKSSQIKSYEELSSILQLLGASKEQIKLSRTALDEKIEHNKIKKTPNYITKGLWFE